MAKYYNSWVKTVLLFFISLSILSSCSDDFKEEEVIIPEMEVILNDVPYKTEKFQRIGYTLRTWEYEKDSLRLKKIIVLDASNNSELYIIEGDELASLHIYKSPLPFSRYFLFDKLDSYYCSIQLPLSLEVSIPEVIKHRLIFTNLRNNEEIIKEGGQFSTRKDEMPVEISSPVKGSNWRLMNQSTIPPHFSTLYHVNGKIYNGERYATDYIQLNDNGLSYTGDVLLNPSFESYREGIYAVADGKVVKVLTEVRDNSGKNNIVNFSSPEAMAGNYIIIKIGEKLFAIYSHCFPGIAYVEEGQIVKEGELIALIGNSGWSTEPHLHFQISDTPDFYFSRGVPYTLKQYKKIKEYPNVEMDDVEYLNSIPEENSIVWFFDPTVK